MTDVAKDGSAILIADKTGSGALYPNTGYGAPNMAYADFTRFYQAINRYDQTGASITAAATTEAPPATKVITGNFTDGIYNLHTRIGARSTTAIVRSGVETHKMVVPVSPAGITQLDLNFAYVSDATAVTAIYYKVSLISGGVITFEVPVPDTITEPVYWYGSDVPFMVEEDTLAALVNVVSCGCKCSQDLVIAYCELVKARLLVAGNEPMKAYQCFTTAKNLISKL